MTASNNAGQPHGRPFEPGHPGGPGRKVGSRNKATVMLDALADGEANDILKKMIELAKAGDLRAADIILSRAWPQRKGRSITVEIPKVETSEDVLKALSKIIEATANGSITTDEAVQFGQILEVKRRSIETVQTEGRLAKIEKARSLPSGQ